MPLVRIDLKDGTTPAFRTQIADLVHQAMVEVLKVPQADRFQVISEHHVNNHIADETYLGIVRGPGCVFIQITLNGGRSVEQKKAFYQMVAQRLHEEAGVRMEDVLINLVEVTKENWSFGNGEAPYA